MGLSLFLPLKLKSQEYDSLKTIQLARNLENLGFNLEGYIINKPSQIQIDYNDKSAVINCPIIAEKSNNDLLMDYPFFIAFNIKDSANTFYKNFINSYGGLGFILDDNTVSPQVYADSIKKLLKKIPSSVTNYKNRLENKLHGVYPNPSNGLINVRYDIKNNSNVTFNLYDVIGRQVKTFSENAVSGENNLNFNSSELPSGIYFLQIVIDSDKKRIGNVKKINIIK